MDALTFHVNIYKLTLLIAEQNRSIPSENS